MLYTVTCKSGEVPHDPKVGEFYQRDNGDVYHLTSWDWIYTAFTLGGCVAWTSPTKDIRKAVAGLTHLPEGSEITIVVGEDKNYEIF